LKNEQTRKLEGRGGRRTERKPVQPYRFSTPGKKKKKKRSGRHRGGSSDGCRARVRKKLFVWRGRSAPQRGRI